MLRSILSRTSVTIQIIGHGNFIRPSRFSFHKCIYFMSFSNECRTFSCIHYGKYDSFRYRKLHSANLLRNRDKEKTFTTSALVFTKQFTEVENSYAYSVLERSSVYSNTLAPKNYLSDVDEVTEEQFKNLLSKAWDGETEDNVFIGFKQVSLYSKKTNQLLSDAKFENIVKSLIEKCSLLSDENLIGILSCLREWPPSAKISSPNFSELWNAIDKECFVRMGRWDRNKLLYVADHWNLLHLARVSDFMWHCIVRLSRRPEKLTPSHLVQCMFYLNLRRKFPPHISVYDFEFSLQKCIEQLSVDEISIMAMGFFKSSTPIVNQNLLMEMMRCIMNDADSINEIALAALLKIIRLSLQPNGADMLYTLLEKLVPQIDRLSLLCLTHIALAGTNVLLYHETAVEKIVRRLSKEVEIVRLKDLERMTFALTLYGFEDKAEPSIYELIAKELCKTERSTEIQQYPKCLSCCLHYLTLQKIYIKNEISKVLDKEFIRNVYGSNNYKVGREILSLDVSVELECPDYDGSRLQPKVRTFLSKIYTDKVWTYEDLLGRKLSATDTILMEVISTASSILGSHENVHLGHLLPHRERADITYGLRSNGSAVAVPSEFRNLDIGTCRRAPDIPDTKWYCIVVGGWNSYIRNLNVPVGSFSSKLRHLRLLGFTPVLVPWFEWRTLSAEEQERYLTRKIFAEFEDTVTCMAR